MLKSLLMASALTLAFSGTAMADDAPSVGTAGCTSCALPSSNETAPLKLAQLGPVRANPVQVRPAPVTGRAVSVRGDWEQNPKDPPAVRSCCDPVLASIDMKTMFSMDLAPSGNLTSNYGLKFNTTPAFNTAFDNTAFIVTVMAGLNPYGFNWLLMTEEMKTDNIPGNTTWPSPISTGWTGTSIAPNPGWLAWNQSPPTTATGTNSPHNYAAVNPSGHMRPDGTVYVMKISFWLYSYIPGQGWTKRPVYCNNVPDRFVGIRLNTAGMKIAPGGKPALEMLSQDANQGMSNAKVQVGQASKLSQAEVDELPAEIRASAR
jgi:hypothetical protein